MKSLILGVAFIFQLGYSLAQNNQENYFTPFTHVLGSAQMEIIPDEIHPGFTTVVGQDTLKIYFLHGSKPKKKYKEIEKKWFGGKHGGHVGISINNNEILHFLPTGKTKIFKNKYFDSKYVLSKPSEFWDILGRTASPQTTVIKIPVSNREIFDSIKRKYLEYPPYDYALFGYRCASASYDILAQLHLLNEMTNGRTITKIFYPKILRKKLIKIAQKNWIIETTTGNSRRKWER